MRCFVPLMLCVSLLTGAEPHMDLQRASMLGFKLDASAVAEMEQRLAAAPEDLPLRATLLGYYFRHGHDLATPRRAHILWLIRNHPDEKFASTPECGILSSFDPQGYAEGREAWAAALTARPEDNVRVRIGMARFLMFDDRPQAVSLLRDGLKTAPDNQDLQEALVSLLRLNENPQDLEEVYQLETTLLDHGTEKDRYHRLGKVAEAALRAQHPDQARQLALQWIETCQKDRSWNTGNAIHDGHQLLGLVALDQGDPITAVAELAAAGTSTGSPQLNSFGPDFRLARALLERGRRTEVAAYLRQVSTFWKKPKVDTWITELERGGNPDLKR